MNNHYLAFDFGALTGRGVLARLSAGLLTIENTWRFSNDPVEYGGGLHWDLPRLWWEVRNVLYQTEKTPLISVGADAWGVDYALLDEQGQLLENPFHYRDARTEGVMEEVFAIVPREDIYRATGIQFMPINTLYQLAAAKRAKSAALEAARHLVTIPDLFHYWLTGRIACEYTIATTTQLVNPRTRNWNYELLERLALPGPLLPEIVEPASELGTLVPGLRCGSRASPVRVVAPASHDTGSAVAAVSARDGTAFISSGTWSLVGTELDEPMITSDCLRLNFTNEGGVAGTTRFLKNVMGMWLLEKCREAWAISGADWGVPKLLAFAAEAPRFRSLFDPDHESFLRAKNMPAAIDTFCAATAQDSPKSPGGYTRAILESLALKYRLTIENLETLTRRKIDQIRIIGGGSKNRVLNQFTADATGRCVLAGPAEATALGNVGVQMMATGAASSLQEMRAIIDRSFPTESFRPADTEAWNREAERFRHYREEKHD
ncbi:MAG: rhamnulokinase family protein [Candidatus Acidiferrales bacterium]